MASLSVVDPSEPTSQAFDVLGFRPVPTSAKYDRAYGPGPDTIAVARSRADFEALETEWNALFARAAAGRQLFQNFNWIWHWSQHYLPRDETTRGGPRLAIVTVRRAGRLILIWPLVTHRRFGLTTLSWAGEPVSQYGDVLVDDVADRAAVIAQAFRHIRANLGADLIELRKVRADALVAPVLKAAGLPVVAAEEAPFADLAKAGTWANFEQRFHAKAVKNRRRHLRRFEERGCVAFTQLDGGDAAADAARACIVHKRAWLAGKGLVSRAFADTRIDAFFADAARGGPRPIDTKLSIVTSAGEFADIGIAIAAKDHRALHIIAYNLKFERYGAGALNLEAGLKRAMADGVATFDFMAPRHDYKMEWADGVVLVEDYAVGLTRAGQIYTRVCLDLVKNGVKSALKAMPPRLQHLIASLHRGARSRGG